MTLRYQHLIDACAGDEGKLRELALLLSSATITEVALYRRLCDPKFLERLDDVREAVDYIEKLVNPVQ